MTNHQSESLEDRLAQRRRLRNKRFINKNSTDHSELTSINLSPRTTRSLDRQSSKRIAHISLSNATQSPDQSNSSSPINKNSNSIFIEKTHSKQKDLVTDNKNNSTPLLPQIAKHQSEKEKHTLEKSLSTNNYSHHEEKPAVPPAIRPTSTENSTTTQQKARKHYEEQPVTNKETILPVNHPTTTENSNPTRKNSQSNSEEKPATTKEAVPPVIQPTTTERSITPQQKARKNSQSHHEVKPTVTKEAVFPISLPATTEKSNPIQPKTLENPPHSYHETVPPMLPQNPIEKSHSTEQNQSSSAEKSTIIKNTNSPVIPLTLIKKSNPSHKNPILDRMKDHPSSDPQSSNYRHPKHFHFPSFASKPIARTTSEQIVSIAKHRSHDSIFGKHDSLALSYLFNKRMIDSESTRLSSLNPDQSQLKTVWD